MPRFVTVDDIQVATARGPGAGRFLAVSLTEALASGTELVAIVESPSPPPDGVHGIDFVFSDHDGEEVIRAGVDAGGKVVSAEILRRPGRPDARPQAIAVELLSLLREADLIAELHWDDSADSHDGPALLVTVHSHSRVRFPTRARA